jgi:nicotinamidase-related amidase
MTSDLPKTIRQLAGIAPVIPKLSASALILIDEQNEYVEGPLKLNGIAEAHAVNMRILAAARAAGADIVHIAQKGAPGGPFDRTAHRGGFIDGVTPQAHEPIVEKTFASAFAKTTLDDVLAGVGKKSLIIVGYMTHNCVTGTAFDAVTRDYAVTVVADATATRDLPDGMGGVVRAEVLQQSQLTGLSDRQALIVTSEALLAAQ